METGMIFNIQRYALHDGPGIRTTVFFKGCPLDCWWCHNPESKRRKGQFIHKEALCIHCESCIRACEQQALSFQNNSLVRRNRDCGESRRCEQACPTGAIELIGKIQTVEQVMEVVLKDRIFYDESGGGVTFSGGEPLMQPEFLAGLLKACKEQGIHTTLDTSGYATWRVLEGISHQVDLFLFDLKHLDDDRHRLYTGVSNQVILENLKRLVLSGKEILLRVPVIPGINDGENLVKTAELAAELGLRKMHIMAYHGYGMEKYKRLGETYRLPDQQAPSQAEMEAAAAMIREFDINVIIGG